MDNQLGSFKHLQIIIAKCKLLSINENLIVQIVFR